MSHALNYKVNPSWRIGVVTSRFNKEITEKLLVGAIRKLSELGVSAHQIESVSVPGAYEIPLAAKWLLEKKCHGVIALGAVIRGETGHYDFICNSVERGCTTLQIESGKPVVFGVLTTEDEAQAINRSGGHHGHKGEDAVFVLIEMLNLYQSLNPHKTKEHSHDRDQSHHSESIFK